MLSIFWVSIGVSLGLAKLWGWGSFSSYWIGIGVVCGFSMLEGLMGGEDNEPPRMPE